MNKKIDRKLNFSIIGCGVSGLSALAHLIDDEVVSNKISKILIFDKHPIINSNIYHHATDDLFLNTSTSLNSLLEHKPHDFYHWVIKNRDKWQQRFPKIETVELHSFLPRNLFLLYMQDLFKSSLRKAHAIGIQIEIINSYVESIEPINQGQFILKSQVGIDYVVQRVICAIGDGKCHDKYEHLKESINYLERPCQPYDYYRNIFQARSILIIGTMLSAVDAALLLQNCQAKITLASKTGTFPSVRRVYQNHLENYYEFLKFDNINDLLKAFLSKLPPTFSSVTDTQDLTLYKNKDDSWCDYVAPFLNRTNDLWAQSPDIAKDQFKSFFNKSRAKRYMSSIPPIIADKLSHRVANNNILVKKDLENVFYMRDSGKFKAVYLDYEESFDACINASAATNNAKTSLNPEKFLDMRNFHVIGDSNDKNFINNGIFLFVREVKKILVTMRQEIIDYKTV